MTRPDVVASGALLHVLLALAVVVVASRLLGALFERVRQPAVIGEVVAGILLGPTLLGRVAPDLSRFLLPPSVLPQLATLAQVGVVLFMFLVGLELDPRLLRERTRATVAVSTASIALPMGMGLALALPLHARLAPEGVPFHAFALFLGVSLSVTAFPVLARILAERKLSSTPLGALALACAAINDVTAWCLLAAVVGVARADGSAALRTLGLTAAFVVLMLVAARPLVHRLVRRREGAGGASQREMAVVVVGLLISAMATEWIGIHALFGAFLFGAIVPHDAELAHDVSDKLTSVVVVLLLPAFFAAIGMRTQLGLLAGGTEWAICALVIAVAVAGKLGGTFVAARFTGLGARDAAALGALMNTRGLMELVVLDVGLSLGVVSPTLFAMLVVMALVTTFMTSPALQLLRLDRAPAAAPLAAAAPRA